MSRPKLRMPCVTVVVLAVVVGAAHASVLKPYSDRELATLADAIVVGTVVGVSPNLGTGLPGLWTDIDVRVDIPVKNARAGETLRLTMPGGRQGDGGQLVPGTPTFRIGEQALLYIERTRAGHLGAMGWRQGKWDVRRGRLSRTDAPLGAVISGIERYIGNPGILSPRPVPLGNGLTYLPQRTLTRPTARTVLAPGGNKPGGPDRPEVVTDIKTEDFEGAWPNDWAQFGNPTWGDTSYAANGGSWSGYCCDEGTGAVAAPGPYPANMSAWMVYGPFDLTDAVDAHLTFETRFNVHSGDAVQWGRSSDGTNFNLIGYNGSTAGAWVNCPDDVDELDLSSHYGDDEVWIAFRFASDAGTNTAEGAFIDDIRLYMDDGAGSPTITNITPPSASSNTNTPVTLTGTDFGATEGDVEFPYSGGTNDATIISWADTSIQCRVPEAESGNVRVHNSTGTYSAGYAFDVSFGYMGMKVQDANLPDNREYNSAGTPDAANEYDRLDTSMQTWTSVSSCYAHSRYIGFTSTAPFSNDGVPVLGWFESSWPYASGAIAVCLTWFSGSDITHHDIGFNGEDFTWSDSGEAGKMDIQHIATHELGHWWGLNDLYGAGDSTETMYGMSGAGQTHQRTLESDDQEGIQWCYTGKPALTTDKSSLTFDMTEGGADPATQTVTISNTGAGFLSYYANPADDWVMPDPSFGRQGDDLSVDVDINGSTLTAAGSPHTSTLVIHTSPGGTGTPKSIGITVNVTGADPTLEWAGASGYTTEGVEPNIGAGGDTFTFKVKYTDGSGTDPLKSFCRIYKRRGPAWIFWRKLALAKESGAVATGAVYAGSTTMANFTWKHKFHFQAADATYVTGDAPCDFCPLPEITGAPRLFWTGKTGYTVDGVSPNSGPLGTKFTFKVMYQDSDNQAPGTTQLVVRRNGGPYKTKNMILGGGVDYRRGRIYVASWTATEAGSYTYRFKFDSGGEIARNGEKTSDPTRNTSGPNVTESGLVLSGVTAAPTNLGAQVTFTLSSGASVTAEVFNVAGRPIRMVAIDRPLDAGLQTLIWDGRSATGLPVPAGRYLVRVTARSDSGSRSSGLATLTVP